MLGAGRGAETRSGRRARWLHQRVALVGLLAAALVLSTVVVFALMFTAPALATWATPHELRTAELSLAGAWERAAADALAVGERVLILRDIDIAAWLNHLVEADAADPLAGVATGTDVVTLQYRMRLPLGLRPVVTLTLRPKVVGERLFCAIESARVGRCPMPEMVWRAAVGTVTPDTAAGWTTLDARIGYAWPAVLGVPGGSVAVRELTCATGQLTLRLAAIK